MASHLNIIILEDVKSDALLIEYELRKANFKYTSKQLDNEADYIQALETFEPDLILSDYNLPGFSGMQALNIAKETLPTIPFIFVTGFLDEQVAIDFIRKGAWDYVLKDNYIRLLPAIENTLKLRTERIKLNLALDILKTAKRKYQDLYEYAPDMFLTVHLETGFITECNQTILDYTGYLKSELLNHSIFEFYPIKNVERIKELILPDLLQTGKVDNAEFEIIKKNGEVFHALVNLKAEYGKPNRISAVKAVIRDITVRKQQEEIILESETRFKTIFNKSEDPILILDYINHDIPLIKDINSNFLTKLGYTPKEIIGRPVTDLIPHIPNKEIQKHIQKLINGTPFHDKVTYNTMQGQTFYFDAIGSLIKLNNLDYILISARDITEQHKANIKLQEEKEKYAALSEDYKKQNLDLNKTLRNLDVSQKDLNRKVDIINRSPAVSFSWKNEPGWPIDYVSENTEDIFGYKAQDFLSGKVKYSDIIHPDDLKRVTEEVANGLIHKIKKVTHKSYRIISKDKSVKWINDDTVIIKNNGKSSHFEGVITDVTETINYQNELLLSKNKYKTILDSIPDIIIITSHDKKIEFVNKQAEKLFGTELIGTKCHQSLFRFENPCDWCWEINDNNQEKYTREIQDPISKKFYILSSSNILNEDRSASRMTVYKDVTTIRKVQNERLKLFKTLEAGLNEMYVFNTETLIIQYANNRGIENLGYNSKKILKLTPLSFQTEYSEKEFRNIVHPLLTGTKSIVYYETIHRRQNNTFYSVEVSLQLIKQHDESVFLAVVNDISDIIKKDDTIKKLSTAIEQSPITIVITDTAGKIEYVNPKFEEITGYKFYEAIGENPNILKSGNQNKDFYKDMWDTILSGHIWKGEFHNKRKDGSVYWEDAVISPVKNSAGVITNFVAIKEDITERKKIQEKLIESELHFRNLFENSLIGMYLSSAEGQILNANKALCEMLGYTLDELQNLNLEDNKQLSSRRKAFKAIIESQLFIKSFDSIWRTKIGKNLYVRESARKFTADNGEVFYEGSVENITKEKLATIALKRIHNFNEKIIQIGKLGFASYHVNGKCIETNQTYADIVGATPEQILLENFKENKNWQEYDLLEKAQECLESGLQSKSIINAESSYNKHIWVEIHFSRIIRDNKVELLVILKDISSFMIAKKRQFQSKTEYLNLINTINVPVFGITSNGIINEWNEKMEQITGYKRRNVKRTNFNKLCTDPEDTEFCLMSFESEEKIESEKAEINIISKQNKILKLLVSKTVRRNLNNEIEGIICVCQDITEMHNYKLELERKVEERTAELLESLNKEKELGDLKSQFVSMASHEFRTPLAAISFAAGFMKKYWDRIDEESRIKKLDKISTQVSHMTNLLEDVLTIGKSESNKLDYQPTNIDIIRFLNDTIKEIRTINKSDHKIIFKHDISECIIKSDEKIARHIFINLITNAIKFSPDADKVIVNFTDFAGKIIIEVIDFGIGIIESELENIFTPFHRGRNVQNIQGTGLGLAIVKSSAELMKGSIKVESKTGEGTKFTVTLPKK